MAEPVADGLNITSLADELRGMGMAEVVRVYLAQSCVGRSPLDSLTDNVAILVAA